MKAVTYLIYILAYEALTLGGTTYLVGWRHWSPWWFVLGVLASVGGYSPAKWAKLYDGAGRGQEGREG